jgi:hypothetical protein
MRVYERSEMYISQLSQNTIHMGESGMGNDWKLQYTDKRTNRRGERSYESESIFLKAIDEIVFDIWMSNLSGVLPNGKELNDDQIREIARTRRT